ncbi:hypothetical protein ISCGN_011444 [Ixodes scapularis]
MPQRNAAGATGLLCVCVCVCKLLRSRASVGQERRTRASGALAADKMASPIATARSGHAEAEQPCHPVRSYVLRGGTFLELRRHTLWLRTPSGSLMSGREE